MTIDLNNNSASFTVIDKNAILILPVVKIAFLQPLTKNAMLMPPISRNALSNIVNATYN